MTTAFPFTLRSIGPFSPEVTADSAALADKNLGRDRLRRFTPQS